MTEPRIVSPEDHGEPANVSDVAEEIIPCVAFGGRTRMVRTDMDLGRGRFRTPEHGLRRAVWDIAHGYVSGFRKRDIAYYVLTRSFARIARSADVTDAQRVATEPDRTRAAVVRALLSAGREVAEDMNLVSYENGLTIEKFMERRAGAIENGADW